MDAPARHHTDFCFGPYRLAGSVGLLWHHRRVVPLSPKASAVLRQHAPSWLVHLPGVAGEAERVALWEQVQGRACSLRPRPVFTRPSP
jgi:hypothetical protein